MVSRTEIGASSACATCGTAGILSHRVVFEGTSVRYAQSFICGSCGAASESDSDCVPDDVAALILGRDGRWSLQLERVTGPLGDAVRGLTEVFGLGRLEALRLAKALPARAPIEEGVREGLAALSEVLAQRGVTSRVERVD